MFVIVNHTIKDPAEFWARAQKALPSLPDGIKIHGVFPAPGGAVATCLWEGRTMGQLREYLEANTGDVATNQYMEVDAGNAMGLPK
jgi:hypothetical protein